MRNRKFRDDKHMFRPTTYNLFSSSCQLSSSALSDVMLQGNHAHLAGEDYSGDVHTLLRLA